MGKTLYFYTVKEQLVPLGICFFGLCFILITGRLMQLMQYLFSTGLTLLFYFACNKEGIITTAIETLTERYRKYQVKSDYFTEDLFYTLLPPEQVAFIERQLGQRKDLLVNTDGRPVTYFLNLVLWDSLTGGRLHGLFHRLERCGYTSISHTHGDCRGGKDNLRDFKAL